MPGRKSSQGLAGLTIDTAMPCCSMKAILRAPSQYSLPIGQLPDFDGRVLGSGMAVVDEIAALPLYNAGSPFDSLPPAGASTWAR